MNTNQFTSAQIEQYNKDGYIIIKNFCSKEEVAKMYGIAVQDDAMAKNALDLNDQTGKKTKLSLWFTPGNDIFGYLTRSERMVNRVAQVLDSKAPVCHFHSKLMQKEPKVGGAWEWHQDYGYWYKNGFLYPESMVSVMIALTDANIQNGCLQVLKGTHHMQRIEHHFAGEQQGADMAFVEEAAKVSELVYCELKAGDVLFFHPNLMKSQSHQRLKKALFYLLSQR